MTEALPDWPIYGLTDDVRPAMAEAIDAGDSFALVTLIRAEGGAPRPAGTQMVVGRERLSGFLSGGCVEGDVALHARAALADGDSRRLIYGEGSPYPDIRLLCGAQIELLVEPIRPDDAAVISLLAAWRERRAATLVTDGQSRRISDERGPLLQVGSGTFHVKRGYDPTPRLVVIGGDPTALAIADLGARSGFETWLVRPRGPAQPPPLVGVRYDRRPVPAALTSIGLDAWTFVAVATHDIEIDEEALRTALPSSTPYVGVLGARRRLPERRERLRRQGVSEANLARLKGPIGLDLGGKSPFEIAIAVLGEIVATRARGELGGDQSRSNLNTVTG